MQQTELFLMFDHFLPNYPLTTQKIKNLKKWKKAWRYHHFKCAKNHDHIYTVPEIGHIMDVIFLLHFFKNYDQMMYDSWDMVCEGRMDGQMNGWTNGQTEKVTYRGGCPT